tara:strand:+ start:50 stop:532 length:483 start_codon:yes stop_codon:yes gene_type:complete
MGDWTRPQKIIMLLKSKIKFERPFDFNTISHILDTGHYTSAHSSQWINDYALNSTFQINKVHTHPLLANTFQYFEKNFNKTNLPADFHLFYSMQSGVKSNIHRDVYDVYILGAFGRTLYKIEDKEYIVEPGNILHIPKGHLHVAIGLDPRIIISYGLGSV